jgi:hypothetical protein
MRASIWAWSNVSGDEAGVVASKACWIRVEIMPSIFSELDG